MKKEIYNDRKKASRLQTELEMANTPYDLKFEAGKHQMDTEITHKWVFEFDPDKLLDGLLEDKV